MKNPSAFLLDSLGNVVGIAETCEASISISNSLTDDGVPANGFKVRVSRSKAANAKARRSEFIPEYSPTEYGVFVRSDMLRHHKSNADRLALELQRRAAAKEAGWHFSVSETMRLNREFQEEMKAKLGD
ncbi:MAG: hypothetical protein J0I77_09545 [Rudaea sp.]|uniref:hypothetical protein n=1 Tax=unclassified Rudaea TaxID=2627037 RepID=UPI0010F798B2|nr:MULTISPECIES: hypothetical protein [unclassified Rudaea]MBN8885951.1 hypothetical protein [Rudaea sp.]MBR0347045.1 hypothetical protein [Rudaea sp.]